MKKLIEKFGKFFMSKWGLPILALVCILFSPIILLWLLVWGQIEEYFMTPEEKEAAEQARREAEWDDGYTP